MNASSSYAEQDHRRVEMDKPSEFSFADALTFANEILTVLENTPRCTGPQLDKHLADVVTMEPLGIRRKKELRKLVCAALRARPADPAANSATSPPRNSRRSALGLVPGHDRRRRCADRIAANNAMIEFLELELTALRKALAAAEEG